MFKRFFLILAVISVNTFCQYTEEMRACWVTNVDSYVMSSDKNISAGMDYLASIGVNLVFPVVWNNSYTLYPSQVMNSLFGKPINPSFGGRDPLKTIVIEAHRNGIEVIPWFEYGFSSSYSSNGGHILAKFPQWASKTIQDSLVVKNGFDWMAGINPEVQNFIISLVTEVCDNYDIDGVQGDDRLPALPVEGGYDSTTVAIYKAENGGNNPPTDKYNPSWMRWRANKLNSFYKRMKDSVKVRGANLIFSSAPSAYPWGYDNYLQDSKTWVEDGTVENFIPQLYRQTLSNYQFEVNKALSYVPQNKRNIFFAGILGKSGSYVISPSLLVSSINYNRQQNIKGESIFFYEAYRYGTGANGDTLKNGLYSTAALLPYRNNSIWRPKAEVVNEDDPQADTTGKWQKFSISGFKPNLLMSNDTNYFSISYNFDVKYDAYYDIFTYIIANTVNSTNARYLIFGANETKETFVDQRNPQNTGWNKIGSVYLTKGLKKVVQLDNSNLEKGKWLVADATMLMINRKLSPDVVITEIKENFTINKLKPTNFNLEQNYPNPFNPLTKIKFSIPYNSKIDISVYNIMGEKITTLTNKFYQEGFHEVEFNPVSLPSGVYFYELKTENSRQTKKMIYLK